MKERICIFLLAALMLFSMGCGGTKQDDSGNTFTLTPTQPEGTHISVSFDYEKQSGYASNQFAVWVEDAQGRHVQTLYATSFTAEGGWEKRELSIPGWVQAFGIADADSATIDAISGATPQSGRQQYTWDCTGADGSPAAEGVYTIVVEATLRDENRVLYKAEIDTAAGAQTLTPQAEFFGESDAERGMLTNVEVGYTP